jgi:hypothetical protein
MQCGGSFFSSLIDTVKKVASNPMVQGLVKAAAPHALGLAQKYAPGLTSKVQGLVANPMAQKAFGAVRSHVGLGRRRKHHAVHGAAYPLGHMSPGEAAYATQRAAGAGRRRKHHGGFGLGDAMGAVKGISGALGPVGALAGPLMDMISGPPPPPPHASFQAVREGPSVAARPHGIGRGKGKHHMVHHACPHCGGAHAARHTTQKHKCKQCGGSFFSSLVDTVKKVASNPMVQGLVKAAAPHALGLAQKYAPGLTSKVQSLAAHPMAQKAFGAVRSHVGLGKRTRAPTAHSKAVGHVMRETGMGLSAASKHVKHHGLARHFA